MTGLDLLFVGLEAIAGAAAGRVVTSAALRTAHDAPAGGASNTSDGSSVAGSNLPGLRPGLRAATGRRDATRLPIGEVVGAAITVSACAVGGPTWTGGLASLLGLALLFAAAHDLETLRIPDWLNAILLALAVLLAAVHERLSASLLAGVGVFAALTLLRVVYRRWRLREGLGGGDVKMLAALTVWLGAERLPLALVAASGAALVFVLVGRRDAGFGRLAFAPFIAGGAWVVGLWASA